MRSHGVHYLDRTVMRMPVPVFAAGTNLVNKWLGGSNVAS